MSSSKIRKNIIFPYELYTEAKDLSQKLDVDFSKFVREAIKQYVKIKKKEKLEKELAEAYKAKAKLNLKVCEDFKYVDGENI